MQGVSQQTLLYKLKWLYCRALIGVMNIWATIWASIDPGDLFWKTLALFNSSSADMVHLTKRIPLSIKTFLYSIVCYWLLLFGVQCIFTAGNWKPHWPVVCLMRGQLFFSKGGGCQCHTSGLTNNYFVKFSFCSVFIILGSMQGGGSVFQQLLQIGWLAG